MVPGIEKSLPTDYYHWSPNDVQSWLLTNGDKITVKSSVRYNSDEITDEIPCSNYVSHNVSAEAIASQFCNHYISGDILATIDDDDLIELGIAKIGQRKLVLLLIDELIKSGSSSGYITNGETIHLDMMAATGDHSSSLYYGDAVPTSDMVNSKTRLLSNSLPDGLCDTDKESIPLLLTDNGPNVTDVHQRSKSSQDDNLPTGANYCHRYSQTNFSGAAMNKANYLPLLSDGDDKNASHISINTMSATTTTGNWQFRGNQGLFYCCPHISEDWLKLFISIVYLFFCDNFTIIYVNCSPLAYAKFNIWTITGYYIG